MNRAITIAVAIAAAAGTHYAVEAYRHRMPSQAELSQKMDELRAKAEREHPGMAKTDALKEVAAAEATRKLATQNESQQAATAASMFWGFYYMNTKGRTEYCRARGVDLAPFVAAFDAAHSAEKQKAQLISTRVGIDAEKYVSVLMPQFAPVVEQDMKDFTTGAQVPLDQACQLINDNAKQVAELIQMPPNVKQVLVAYD